MKLIMTLLVRDEEDIIKENIDFHRSLGVDYFIVTDNLSVDNTRNILKEYEKKGILLYISETNDNYNQKAWVTRMAKLAFDKFNADWVINNDADEFWWPKTGDLKEAFKKIPSYYNILEVKRHNFVPVELGGLPFYQQMIYREKISLNPLGLPLPIKVAHRGDSNIVILQGNHKVANIEQSICREEVIEIFHYPLRTYKQFENKISNGGAAYARNTFSSKKEGVTWKKLYHEYLNNRLESYYKKHVLNNETVRTQIKNNIIIEDMRFSNYFSKINEKWK